MYRDESILKPLYLDSIYLLSYKGIETKGPTQEHGRACSRAVCCKDSPLGQEGNKDECVRAWGSLLASTFLALESHAVIVAIGYISPTSEDPSAPPPPAT